MGMGTESADESTGNTKRWLEKSQINHGIQKIPKRTQKIDFATNYK